MKIEKLKSSKLFWNKWPYKVCCRIGGANKITIFGLDRALLWCDGKYSSLWNSAQRTSVDKDALKKFILKSKDFIVDREQVQIRAEGDRFNLFLKDKDLLKKIHKELSPWITTIYGPTTDEEYNYLMENNKKKVLCDTLPRGTFKYKIFLKERMKSLARENFLLWSNRYTSEQILISPTTSKWLNGEKFYKQDPFFYIRDDAMLTMIRLFLGDNLKIVHEYVTRDKLIKE